MVKNAYKNYPVEKLNRISLTIHEQDHLREERQHLLRQRHAGKKQAGE
jgi:hypothetical protein